MTSRPNAGYRVRSRRGFSLIEVMVASVVLVLVLMSSITALQMGFKMVDNARMASLANQAIQSQIESIKLLHWGYIGDIPSLNSSGHWYFQSKQFTGNLTAATTVEIASGKRGISFLDKIQTVMANASPTQLSRITQFDLAVQNWAISGVRQVRVIVSWRGLNGKQTFMREFVTLYSQNGLFDYNNS
jgi:prepilin-type N-terminal cleavage/methylation domain-containing protein